MIEGFLLLGAGLRVDTTGEVLSVADIGRLRDIFAAHASCAPRLRAARMAMPPATIEAIPTGMSASSMPVNGNSHSSSSVVGSSTHSGTSTAGGWVVPVPFGRGGRGGDRRAGTFGRGRGGGRLGRGRRRRVWRWRQIRRRRARGGRRCRCRCRWQVDRRCRGRGGRRFADVAFFEGALAFRPRLEFITKREIGGADPRAAAAQWAGAERQSVRSDRSARRVSVSTRRPSASDTRISSISFSKLTVVVNDTRHPRSSKFRVGGAASAGLAGTVTRMAARPMHVRSAPRRSVAV